jgi:hypothetical protein
MMLMMFNYLDSWHGALHGLLALFDPVFLVAFEPQLFDVHPEESIDPLEFFSGSAITSTTSSATTSTTKTRQNHRWTPVLVMWTGLPQRLLSYGKKTNSSEMNCRKPTTICGERTTIYLSRIKLFENRKQSLLS